MRNLTRSFVAVLILSAMAGAATADETADVAAARLHYRNGTRAFELGHYDEAVKEYEAAYEAKDDPALLFNIAQAYRLNGDKTAALRTYKSYLHRVPQAENADEVKRWIAELQAAIDEDAKKEQAAPTEPQQPMPPPVHEASPLAVAAAPPAPHRPIYKRWYFWTAIGVVVAGGVAVALVLTIPRSDGFKSTIPDVGPAARPGFAVHF